MVKHPHHHIILAYLEGKTIQIQEPNNCWKDLDLDPDNWLPSFSPKISYRLKPIEYTYEETLVMELHNGRARLRDCEHWELGNIKVTFKDGKFKKVEKL